MLNFDVKRKINTLRDILVGKVPDPKAQVEQITIALIYKFMDDMDLQAADFGGEREFFKNDYSIYAFSQIMLPEHSAQDRLNLYAEGIDKMTNNPDLPKLFRDILRNAYIPYRDPETLNRFLKEIAEFSYEDSEELGNAFEYLLSIMGSQGDAVLTHLFHLVPHPYLCRCRTKQELYGIISLNCNTLHVGSAVRECRMPSVEDVGR